MIDFRVTRMMSIPKSSMSPLEHQQFQRLKVNRIAVLQELKVDHILQYLLSNSVLNHNDITKIEKGRSTTEKSKLLLDILPTKGRASNWYRHFRAALLNPSVNDTSVKHKYQILVEFLDNTIIDQMSHPVSRRISQNTNNSSTRPSQRMTEETASLSKYKPLPEISNSQLQQKAMIPSPPSAPHKGVKRRTPTKQSPTSQPTIGDGNKTKTPPTVRSQNISALNDDTVPEMEESTSKWSMRQLKDTKIPFTVQYWDHDPENFECLIELPEQEIIELEKSTHIADINLGEQKRDAVDRMHQLEIAYFLYKTAVDDSASEMVLCTCSAVLDIIMDPNSHHLYFKYFDMLKREYDMELALEIVFSYDEVTQWLACESDRPTLQMLVDIGFNLITFLTDYGHYDIAMQVISSIESLLANQADMWILIFTFYVKCMSLYNRLRDLEKSDKYHMLASSLRDRITKAMNSFGGDTLDCSKLFMETSIMMRELGSLGPSYTWSQKSMQEVDIEDRWSVVDVLCNASAAYAHQWKILRAEDLAVEAVQQAKMYFGVYHPVYLKALQNFVSFSNQFRHDSFGVEASKTAVNIATKIYGFNLQKETYSNIQLACSLQGHAAALIAAGRFDNGAYFDIAEKAYRIASEFYPPKHPLLMPYIQTLVHAILNKARLCRDEKQSHELLLWAESEAKQEVSIMETKYGEISHKTALSHMLLADVYAEWKRTTDSEAYYNMALNTLDMCLGSKHGSVHIIKVKLARMSKDSGDLERAKALLREVIEGFDTAAYYVHWYDEAYELLIECYEITKSYEILKEYRSRHMGWKWISEDNMRLITWREIHSAPEGYDSFLERIELWRSKVKKVQDHLELLRNNQALIGQKS